MKQYLTEQIKKSLDKLHIPRPSEIIFTKTKDERFGHLATNVAMMLAKNQSTNPRDLAQQICSSFQFDPDLITKCEIAGGGFINFFFSPLYLYRQLAMIIHNADSFGRHDLGQGKRANVEFVSANPTGPLSIGHGRQAVLGDVISRILENSGYEVTREYYFNNAGGQMARLGESTRLRYMQILGEEIAFPEKHYEGEYIRNIAQGIFEQYGDSWRTKNYESFKEIAEGVLFENIKKVLKRLDLEFDVFYNEDSLYKEKKLEKIVQAFREKGLAYEKDGATWLKTSEIQYDHGPQPDKDKVIIKSSGEPTYRLPDMAYHVTKFERRYDLIVDIFGADHVAEYPDVLAGLKALGFETSHVRVLIHQFVTLMKEGEILKMSKRLANYVTIDELLDLLGPDVFRYFLIMRSHNSHFNFDLELALKQSLENPAYYIQNAHARISSILAKAQERGFLDDRILKANLTNLTANEERSLIQKLLEFPDLTERLVLLLEAHPLTTYLEELAGIYHHYQTAGKKDAGLRVITDNEELTYSRLALLKAVRIVIARGLYLLGVTAPERMSRVDTDIDEIPKES